MVHVASIYMMYLMCKVHKNRRASRACVCRSMNILKHENAQEPAALTSFISQTDTEKTKCAFKKMHYNAGNEAFDTKNS